MDIGCWGMAPSTLAQWLGAVGTIAAVIVALFKDPIIGWRRRPRLDATCTKEIPWTVKVHITRSGYVPGQGTNVLWRGNCYFVRIKVANTGRTRAEKVQVCAMKLAKRGADDRFADRPTALPFNMKWSNNPPTGPVSVLEGISPKMSAFCDIIALCDPANPHQRRPRETPANKTVGELQLEFDMAEECYLLAPGTYRLTLRIAAANVEPIDRIVEFRHEGTWLEDDSEMRRDNLSVSLIKGRS
jgi:hypothetical protein